MQKMLWRIIQMRQLFSQQRQKSDSLLQLRFPTPCLYCSQEGPRLGEDIAGDTRNSLRRIPSIAVYSSMVCRSQLSKRRKAPHTGRFPTYHCYNDHYQWPCHFCVCMYIVMYLHGQTHMYIQVCMHLCVHMQSSDVNLWCLSLGLIPLFMERGSLLGLVLSDQTRPAGQ